MRKQISIDKLKKLPEGMDVYCVEDSTGRTARMWIGKTYKGKKLLKGIFIERRLSEVMETPGWHFEIDV